MRDYVILIGIKHFSKGYHDRHDLFCNLCFHLYTCF